MESAEEYRTPGQLIEELMRARGWTQRVLGVVLGIDRTAVGRIIAGTRPVTAEMAIALGELFSERPRRFLDLQTSYDLARAQHRARPDPARAARACLFGDLPIVEMAKRGWLDVDDPHDVAKVERALTKFFGVRSSAEIEVLPHAAKKTNVFGEASPEQVAWLRRVAQIASEMLVPRYSAEGAARAVEELYALRVSADAIRKVPRILETAGIRFVIVESLSRANIDGACFWIDERSPVVGMTMRFDRIDNFWFVLRHELEHVLLGHGKEMAMLDADLEGARAGSGDGLAEEERLANAAASEFCVPQNSLQRFMAIKAPFFPKRDVLAFAKIVRAHPGLIAGQIQHKTGRFDLLREHQVKVRSIVSPGASVDGWGDVYPVES